MEQLTGKSGRELLEAMMSGELPYPPMNETMNMTLLDIGDGRAVFQGIPLPQHYNPLGTVHGGWFASLMDSALGCAVQTTLPAGRSYTTVELSMVSLPQDGPPARSQYSDSRWAADCYRRSACGRRNRQAVCPCNYHLLRLRCSDCS